MWKRRATEHGHSCPCARGFESGTGKFRDAPEKFGRKRKQMLQAVRLASQYNNGKRQRADFVLVRQVFVHCQKHIKLSGARRDCALATIFPRTQIPLPFFSFSLSSFFLFSTTSPA